MTIDAMKNAQFIYSTFFSGQMFWPTQSNYQALLYPLRQGLSQTSVNWKGHSAHADLCFMQFTGQNNGKASSAFVNDWTEPAVTWTPCAAQGVHLSGPSVDFLFCDTTEALWFIGYYESSGHLSVFFFLTAGSLSSSSSVSSAYLSPLSTNITFSSEIKIKFFSYLISSNHSLHD